MGEWRATNELRRGVNCTRFECQYMAWEFWKSGNDYAHGVCTKCGYTWRRRLDADEVQRLEAILGAPVPAGPQRIERECGCAWELIVDGEDAACERVATCEGHPGGCPRPYVWPKIVAYLVETEREGS